MRKIVFFSLISSAILGMLKIFSIVPFNRMAADDFSYAVVAKNLGFFNSQLFWYRTWTGRFTATFLQIFFTGLTGPSGKIYLYSALTFSLLFLAFAVFFQKLLDKSFKNFTTYVLAAVCTVILYFLTPNKTESWYWLTGSATYLWPIILYLFGISFLFKQEHRLPDFFIAGILIFLSTGGNETFGFLEVISLIWLTLRKRNKFNLFLTTSSIIGFAVVFLSPGNGIRANGNEGTPMNIVGSFLYSLQYGPQHLFSIISGNLYYLVPVIILFAYLFSGFSVKENINVLFNKAFEFIVAPVFFSIFFLLPAFKILGRIPPDRTDISLAFMMVLSIIGISFYLGKIIDFAKIERSLLFKIFITSTASVLFVSSFGFVNKLASDVYIARNYSQAYDSMIKEFTNLATKNNKKDIIVSLPDSGLVAVTLDPVGQVWYKNQALSDFYGIGRIITK